MGFFSRLLGIDEEREGGARRSPPSVGGGDQALARYRYMLQTAPPETIEQAHAEAFAQLSPEARRQVLTDLIQMAPVRERAAIEATSSDDPQAMARVATRAEIRQPGVMERTLARPGIGFGGGLLSSFAAGFVGSLVAQSFFSALGGFGTDTFGDAGATASAGDADGGVDANYAEDGNGLDGVDDGGGFGGDFDA